MTRARFFVVVVAILLLAACGSNRVVPDRHYSLVLAANDSAAPDNNEVATARLIVGPIQLPTYLREPGLPMQVGPNRIESAHHHFWAEPLAEAIAKVLAQEISEWTNGIDVERESGRFTPRGDCRVRVEFDAFHPTSESRVVTSGRYWISSEDTSNRQAFSLTRTLTIDGYAHAVDELRGMLATLAQQIADEVQGTPACTGAASPDAAEIPKPDAVAASHCKMEQSKGTISFEASMAPSQTPPESIDVGFNEKRRDPGIRRSCFEGECKI